MKQIQILEKLAPYSSLPGTACIVPRSNWVIRAFPALLQVVGVGDVSLSLTGPVSQFLVQLDLERDCVWISGTAQEGPYRFQIKAVKEGLLLLVRRGPKNGFGINGQQVGLQGWLWLAKGGKFVSQGTCERLSLGNWKAQDWDLVCRRLDAREVMPSLFLLGQKVPVNGDGSTTTSLQTLFRTSFSGLLVPHLQDVLHQGLAHPPEVKDPMELLGVAYRTIRAHLIREEGQTICILPGIQLYPVGRAHLKSSLGRIDLEWSQGMIRKMVVRPSSACIATFVFPKAVASFQVSGKRTQAGLCLALEPQASVLFDQFCK